MDANSQVLLTLADGDDKVRQGGMLQMEADKITIKPENLL